MTKVSRPALAVWKLRVRFKMWLPTGNTGGTLVVGMGAYLPLSYAVNEAADNAFIDLDAYTKNSWHDVEVFITPTTYTNANWLNVGIINIKNTDPITGAAIYVSDLIIDESYQTGPNIPQKVQSGAYVLTIADQGHHIYLMTGGVTVPLNSAVSFPVESVVTIIERGGTAQTIGRTSGVTLIKAASGTVTSVSLAAYGVATLLKVESNTWWVMGDVT
jgi:hypothetical protein